MGAREGKSLLGAIGRVAGSLAGAALFYAGWMAVFMLGTGRLGAALEAVLWLLAPVMTAAGFALGIAGVERVTRARRSGFWRTFLWPLVGCAIGAGVVYWFGPMLIVFGMFVGGTAAVVVREVVGQREGPGR